MTNATNVLWLPSRYGKNLKFTRVNGAAEKLQKVSNELDRLPAHFLDYLRPTQGTYNCRVIAGTRHEPSEFAWLRHRDRYCGRAFSLLVMVEA